MNGESSSTPRRGFVGAIAAGAAALVAGRWSTANAEVAASLAVAPPSDAWIAKLKGKHKQVFDCVSGNSGFGAAYPLNFFDSTMEALKLSEKDLTAVLVFRHFAMPLVLN